MDHRDQISSGDSSIEQFMLSEAPSEEEQEVGTHLVQQPLPNDERQHSAGHRQHHEAELQEHLDSEKASTPSNEGDLSCWSSILNAGVEQQHHHQQRAAMHALAAADRHSRISRVKVALAPLVPLGSRFFLLSSSVNEQQQTARSNDAESVLLQHLLTPPDASQERGKTQRQLEEIAHAVLFFKRLLDLQEVGLIYQRNSEVFAHFPNARFRSIEATEMTITNVADAEF